MSDTGVCNMEQWRKDLRNGAVVTDPETLVLGDHDC